MLLGSHLSIAGGLDRALVAASDYGFQAVGLFLRNQRRWKSPPLTDDAVERFRRLRRDLGISCVVAHGSYLINLAAAAPVRRRSFSSLAEEFDRAGRLGIESLVIHGGAHKDVETGIGLIAKGLNSIVAGNSRGGPRILLETTAGQGGSIGHRFENLAAILSRLERPGRFGVCLDTCHVFAAGYDIRTPAGYADTMDAFERTIGLDNLRAIHLNDSNHGLGSRVDRHAHIGHGQIGLAGFANMVNDPRLQTVPMILETPKGFTETGLDWDRINADTIGKLVGDSR